MLSSSDVIVPDWPAPACVRALITTRHGGLSRVPYSSLNLGLHVGDDADTVRENRRRVVELLPAEPRWLNQVHGTAVARIELDSLAGPPPMADAAMTRLKGRPCAVLVADCLPVLFCDEAGSTVAVAHAGWRGLASGVIEQTVNSMQSPPEKLMAFLGPAIGPTAFEVGQDVIEQFAALGPHSAMWFHPSAGKPGKYLADIYQLARQRLAAIGVTQVSGGNRCTVSEPEHFFSYRRDGRTGRMAAIIWRE